MPPSPDPRDHVVRIAAWRALWKILLTPNPDIQRTDTPTKQQDAAEGKSAAAREG